MSLLTNLTEYINLIYVCIYSAAVSTIWSEPLFTDDLIYKIVHNVHPDNEQKNPHEIPIHSDHSDSEDEGYEELTPPEHKEAEFDDTLDDISVELPAFIDFDDFDFF